jgi:hypothetical protein
MPKKIRLTKKSKIKQADLPFIPFGRLEALAASLRSPFEQFDERMEAGQFKDDAGNAQKFYIVDDAGNAIEVDPGGKVVGPDESLIAQLVCALSRLQLWGADDHPALLDASLRRAVEAKRAALSALDDLRPTNEHRLLFPADPRDRSEAADVLAKMIEWVRQTKYAALRPRVMKEMIGMEQALVLAIIDDKENSPLIQELAEQFEWGKDWGDDFNKLARRINKKLSQWGVPYKVSRQNNRAVFTVPTSGKTP